jgi:hypothetical protein
LKFEENCSGKRLISSFPKCLIFLVFPFPISQFLYFCALYFLVKQISKGGQLARLPIITLLKCRARG